MSNTAHFQSVNSPILLEDHVQLAFSALSIFLFGILYLSIFVLQCFYLRTFVAFLIKLSLSLSLLSSVL